MRANKSFAGVMISIIKRRGFIIKSRSRDTQTRIKVAHCRGFRVEFYDPVSLDMPAFTLPKPSPRLPGTRNHFWLSPGGDFYPTSAQRHAEIGKLILGEEGKSMMTNSNEVHAALAGKGFIAGRILARAVGRALHITPPTVPITRTQKNALELLCLERDIALELTFDGSNETSTLEDLLTARVTTKPAESRRGVTFI